MSVKVEVGTRYRMDFRVGFVEIVSCVEESEIEFVIDQVVAEEKGW